MVGYYRLNDFGFRLEAGTYVLEAQDAARLERANDILAEAEATAAKILVDAQTAYEQEKKRGYEEGWQQARQTAVERLLHENVVLDKGLRKIERGIVNLVVDCVRKLIDGFDDVARAEAMVKSALKSMRREKKAELRVPPPLYAHFRKSIGRVSEEFPEIELVDVVEDASLEDSQIILETAIGRVEGNLGRRIEELALLLRDAHARANADRREADGASHE